MVMYQKISFLIYRFYKLGALPLLNLPSKYFSILLCDTISTRLALFFYIILFIIYSACILLAKQRYLLYSGSGKIFSKIAIYLYPAAYLCNISLKYYWSTNTSCQSSSSLMNYDYFINLSISLKSNRG